MFQLFIFTNQLCVVIYILVISYTHTLLIPCKEHFLQLSFIIWKYLHYFLHGSASVKGTGSFSYHRLYCNKNSYKYTEVSQLAVCPSQYTVSWQSFNQHFTAIEKTVHYNQHVICWITIPHLSRITEMSTKSHARWRGLKNKK